MNLDGVIAFSFYDDWKRLNTAHDGYGDYVNPLLKAHEFSPSKARSYFKKAGFTRAGSDGVLINPSGERLSFTLTYGNAALSPIFPFLKEEALKAGVELNIELLDATAYFKKVMEKNGELVFGGFSGGGSYPVYWQFYHSVNAHKPQTNNITNIDNPQLDVLIDEYHASGDKPTMIRLSHAIQKIVFDEAVFIPGFYSPDFRVAYWRWIRFPKDFATRTSTDARDYGLFWIDERLKEETLNARKEGTTFDPQTFVFEQWRRDS
jgi:microcin C transport system substrate-binding protein